MTRPPKFNVEAERRLQRRLRLAREDLRWRDTCHAAARLAFSMTMRGGKCKRFPTDCADWADGRLRAFQAGFLWGLEVALGGQRVGE